jgi:nucleoside-diphosphate-sugar epimerase
MNLSMTTQNCFFVTGGTGFLGSIIVKQLITAGYHVKVLTRKRNLPTNKYIEYIYGDLNELKILDNAIQNCIGIIHCAGEKNIKSKMYETNVAGTQNIFTLAKKHKISIFCHLSSVGVIGRTKSKLIDENTTCSPMNIYERTKREAEDIVNEGIEFGQIIIIRPTNVFGESIISDYYNDSIAKKIKLWLKQKENGHLVYVKDVASAVIYLINRKHIFTQETYIISSDHEGYNLIKDIENVIRGLRKQKPRKSFIKPSIIFPWMLRLIRHGNSNKGDIVYSSGKLLSTGFKFPYGKIKGIEESFYNQNI